MMTPEEVKVIVAIDEMIAKYNPLALDLQEVKVLLLEAFKES